MPHTTSALHSTDIQSHAPIQYPAELAMNLEQFNPTVIRNKPLNWWVQTGSVASVNKYSKTYVSGGGSTNQGTGGVSINSSVVVITEFLLKLADGSEEPVRSSDESLVLREGQKVSLIYGYGEGSKYLIAIFNHDTKRTSLYRSWTDFFHATHVIPMPRYRRLCLIGLLAPGVFMFVYSFPHGQLISELLVGAVIGVPFWLIARCVVSIVHSCRVKSATPRIEPILAKIVSSISSP